LPNISKINAVDIGNIAKVDGATSSNIAKVDGLDFVTFTGLLDTYTGAAAAYSVRQLKSGVTVAMRVRRDTAGGTGDDDEADVAFDTSLATPTISLDSAISNASAGVTATTLGQFINVGTVGGTTYTNPDSLSGTASCFVNEWKDQSGNADHVVQATFGSQPQIHSGTVNTPLITENGKPAVYFADYNYQLADTSGTWGGTNVLTCDFVNVHTLVSGSGLGGGALSEKHFLFWYDGAFQVAQIYNGTYYLGWSRTTTGPSADTNQHLWYGIASNGTGQIRVDGTASTAGTLNTTRYFSGEFAFNGRPGAPTTERGVEQYQQEFIQWDVNQSASNRTAIESNINGFFGIY
jgi:hypothetical protein